MLKMILPVVFVLLCARLTESLFKGESCTMSYGASGVCKSLYDCKSEYDALVAGSLPNTVCGYEEHDPIVCCPLDAPKPPSQTPPPVTEVISSRGSDRGEISRKKCAYYSQFVYTQRYPIFGDPVTVSECAITSQKLIVGGTKAERKEFPHMTAIGYNQQNGTIGWFCGGTLVSENWVITAAHCMYSKNSGDAAWARVGDLNLVDSVNDGASPVTLRIVERVKHPDYKAPAEYNDIALVRLEKKVKLNPWIRPACLHTSESTGTTKAVATGWGVVDWNDEAGQSHLLKVTMALVDSASCQERWSSGGTDVKVPNGINVTSMICAGEEGKDTCQGDSGGPLVIFSPTEYYCMYDLVGVTSIGKICGWNFPGVYTRVYHYVSWIESIVWPQG